MFYRFLIFHHCANGNIRSHLFNSKTTAVFMFLVGLVVIITSCYNIYKSI